MDLKVASSTLLILDDGFCGCLSLLLTRRANQLSDGMTDHVDDSEAGLSSI